MRFKLPRWLPHPHWLLLPSLLLLDSCNVAIMNTKGAIASQQKHLILTSLCLMLIVVIPVLVLTFVFAYKYRASNPKANYMPDWADSTLLETIWWGIPIIIIIALATLTWKASHSLDPYRPLDSTVKPLEVQVIALEWKWLFIYPEQGIAVVSHLRIPAHVPVNFKITGEAPMNSFWIPQLAGQIYAMEGMQTKLALIADELGDYEGVSANFSGEGFNSMKFIARVSSAEDFAHWVDSVKTITDTLTAARFEQLVKPSADDSVHVFGAVDAKIFMSTMMHFMAPTMAMPMPAQAPPSQALQAKPSAKPKASDDMGDMPMGDMDGMK